MRNSILVFLISFCISQDGWTQVKTDESVFFQIYSHTHSLGNSVLFPNPSLQGQDVFIELSELNILDWWVVVTDVNGKEIKGFSATQEGGRIRIHGQVPKPGIYIINYGHGSYRNFFRWFVRG